MSQKDVQKYRSLHNKANLEGKLTEKEWKFLFTYLKGVLKQKRV